MNRRGFVARGIAGAAAGLAALLGLRSVSGRDFTMGADLGKPKCEGSPCWNANITVHYQYEDGSVETQAIPAQWTGNGCCEGTFGIPSRSRWFRRLRRR